MSFHLEYPIYNFTHKKKLSYDDSPEAGRPIVTR